MQFNPYGVIITEKLKVKVIHRRPFLDHHLYCRSAMADSVGDVVFVTP